MSDQYTYRITETFYSIQGEGVYTGEPMFFIRLSGCNINCDFCDTDYQHKETLTIKELITRTSSTPTKYIVITGGEPLRQDIRPLVERLNEEGCRTHLETNGTYDIPPNLFHWITISPKQAFLSKAIIQANEIKVLCNLYDWEDIANSIYTLTQNRNVKLWLMPLTDRGSIIEENIKKAYNYCLNNPEWNFCTQIHKHLNFK